MEEERKLWATAPPQKKSNAKLDSNDKTGSTKEGNVGGTTRTADNNDVLGAISVALLRGDACQVRDL